MNSTPNRKIFNKTFRRPSCKPPNYNVPVRKCKSNGRKKIKPQRKFYGMDDGLFKTLNCTCKKKMKSTCQDNLKKRVNQNIQHRDHCNVEKWYQSYICGANTNSNINTLNTLRKYGNVNNTFGTLLYEVPSIYSYWSENESNFDEMESISSFDQCYCRYCLRLTHKRPVHCRYYNSHSPPPRSESYEGKNYLKNGGVQYQQNDFQKNKTDAQEINNNNMNNNISTSNNTNDSRHPYMKNNVNNQNLQCGGTNQNWKSGEKNQNNNPSWQTDENYNSGKSFQNNNSSNPNNPTNQNNAGNHQNEQSDGKGNPTNNNQRNNYTNNQPTTSKQQQPAATNSNFNQNLTNNQSNGYEIKDFINHHQNGQNDDSRNFNNLTPNSQNGQTDNNNIKRWELEKSNNKYNQNGQNYENHNINNPLEQAAQNKNWPTEKQTHQVDNHIHDLNQKDNNSEPKANNFNLKAQSDENLNVFNNPVWLAAQKRKCIKNNEPKENLKHNGTANPVKHAVLTKGVVSDITDQLQTTGYGTPGNMHFKINSKP